MDSFEKKKLKLYGILWGAVLVIPSLPLLWGTLGITGHFSSMEEIVSLWRSIFPVLALFLAHNFLILPVSKRNKGLYVAAVLVVIALFGIFCFTVGSHPPGLPAHAHPTDFAPPSHRPARPGALMLGFGMLAILANFGADSIVENERKKQELRLLEIDNLRLQLEALRYQINPHYFLNTLNNIQALVLIDPDKAMRSIGLFSKMIQIILRQGNAPVIPLSDETFFLECLTDLMRLRYPENVEIDCSLPDNTGDAVIQPLILSTFVENSFKHGISYEKPSFVRIRMEHHDGNIVFLCENTIHSGSEKDGYGIGLENARKSLSLLYGTHFHLVASPSGDHYRVELTLPDKIDIPAV